MIYAHVPEAMQRFKWYTYKHTLCHVCYRVEFGSCATKGVRESRGENPQN